VKEGAPPTPTADQRRRWQPLRSGIVNLYRFDNEEFHFEDGRLLLRGNNGSGKSRVLALQLPFLLDGEVSPARIEPDGDSAKRIEWNLLMGRHPDRTGYTWIEFVQRTAEGTLRHLTLGCGLRAVAGQTGLHSRWFFVTSRRVGHDLFLQTAQHTPIGRERLAELIGDSGRIIQKVDDYRRTVDEALFGLGPRYGPLLELLLRLRRPQLSRKLDEDELSNALSDALPTLSATIIEDVAESFRSLEADRETLNAFTAARSAVDTFLREYRGYMRIAVRRRAAVVRTAHSGYESAQRSARDAQTRCEAAVAQLESLTRQQAELEVQLSGAESTSRTLRESPEMRTAQEVANARDTAETAAATLTQSLADERRAADAASQAGHRRDQAETQTGSVAADLQRTRLAAESAARAADFADSHLQYLSPTSDIDERTSRPALERLVVRRQEAIALLARHEHEVADAARLLARAEEDRTAAENAASAAREEEHHARERLASAGEALLAAHTAWRQDLRQVALAPNDSLIDAFAEWLEQRVGPSPLQRAAEQAQRDALHNLAAREQSLHGEIRIVRLSLEEIDASIQRLEQGDTPPPPPPVTRNTPARAGRPGAPLWRVCDFRPEVSAEERAGLEAALQSAGLLDAWLLPDGGLLAGADDSFLIGRDDPTPLPARHLGEILTVDLDPSESTTAALGLAAVQEVLRRIGHGHDQGAHWVDPDGTWRLGPLSGRWLKPTAEYIGESTRAATRRRQLSELRDRRSVAGAQLETLTLGLASLARARQEVDAEMAKVPADDAVVRAGFLQESATAALTTTLRASEQAALLVSQRRADWQRLAQARDRDAADLRLASWLGRLDELRQVTQTYTSALIGLWPTARHAAAMLSQLALLREQSAAAEARHEELRTRRETQAAASAAARQRFLTLQEMHGQTIARVLERLGAAEAEVQHLKQTLKTNQHGQIVSTGDRSTAEADRARAEEQRFSHEQSRRTAIERLQSLATHRLLAEADASFRDADSDSWSVAEAVDLARRIENSLSDAADDDATWRRRQDGIHAHIQELRDRLVTHGHPLEPHQNDDLVVVQCLFQGRPHTMSELSLAFTTELSERERLLQAREREIIENHLLAEAAVELQKLIRDAEVWRVSANEELSTRPTSSGVRFRFQWEPDLTTRFHEVRPVLLRRGELWTPPERVALAAFLQSRIEAEKSGDQSGSWRDHLTRALDYRRWHRFVVERQQDGQWRRLDRTTYGTGSGGEKALALTLPRFAAAAAHYRSARPDAPRLIMLDEAFAGIDPTMRGQCMGVLTQFDLDVVMTSELEWGCYPTVPALAIYHLTTLAGIDAVAATRWVWNGRERRRQSPPPPVETPPDAPPATDRPPEAETLLFDDASRE